MSNYDVIFTDSVVEKHQDSLNSLRHHVYFPMSPHEVYEQLMDPELFPTGFERTTGLVPRTPRYNPSITLSYICIRVHHLFCARLA